MSSVWNKLSESSETLSNVKIICSDGVIASHKIIVASASNFLKNFMITIPIGDDVTIFLPEFEKDEVEEILSLNNVKKEIDIFAEDPFLNLEPKYLKVNPEEILQSVNSYPEEVSETTDCFHEEDRIVKDDLFADQLEAKQEMEEEPSYSCSEIIPIKKTKANKKLKKKAFAEAVAYYKTDESMSVRKAALKYNVDHKTLGICIKSGKSYTGRGKQAVFTEDEEQSIVDKALQKVQNGEELNPNILQDLIEEHAELLRYRNPDRILCLSKSFARKFLRRHQLEQIVKVRPCHRKAIDIDDLKNNIQLRNSCEDLKKDLIQNPTTKREKNKNAKIHMKIAYEKALAYYKNEENVSVRKAALNHNVDPKTLGILIKSCESYKGRGKQPKLFTKEEEFVIVSRAKDIINSGKNFNSKVFRQIVKEEVDTININFPERNLKMNHTMALRLAYRNELHKFFPEDNKLRDFECEVCCKKFTFKKSLVYHQKTVHYSFLQ